MRIKFNLGALWAVTLGLGLMLACSNNPKPQTLPVGATSAADATTYRVLADAHAFLQSVRDSVTAGKLQLNGTQKAVFNDFAAAYNIADSEWQTCHAGACSTTAQQQMERDVTGLNVKLAQSQQQIGVTP